ncbi:MAG: LTA synthase family protein [Christensenellaceae bacterium]|jgi:phosphoglycerol transferase
MFGMMNKTERVVDKETMRMLTHEKKKTKRIKKIETGPPGGKQKFSLRYKIGAALFFFGFLFVAISIWAQGSFGKVPFEQVVFHLKMPMEGTSGQSILDFIVKCLPIPILLTVGLSLLVATPFGKPKVWEVSVLKKTFTLRAFPQPWLRKWFVWIALVIFVACAVFMNYQLDITGYIQNQMTSSTLFEEYYVNPRDVTLVFPEEKRNLIYIFLESMENTYMSEELGGAQSEDLIPELSQLALENTSFSSTEALGGVRDLPGIQWTIAGMVSQTAGIPLKAPLNVSLGRNEYGKLDDFLPGAYSLGEILEDQGYNQMVMVGSKLSFAGRDKYFSQHGNYMLWDYYTAIEEGKIRDGYDIGWWGFEDAKLFEYAKEELTELASEKEPFNFTMLTVDTHYPDGYRCQVCGRSHRGQYADVISCSSRQVGAFVEWIKEQDFYENTTIIITGDHNSMDQNFFTKLPRDYVRTNYNVIINAPISAHNMKNRAIGNFD